MNSRDFGISTNPLPDAQRAGDGVGMFVGVNKFNDPLLRSLRYAVNDAVDLAHAFVIGLKLVDPRQAFLSIDEDPAASSRGRSFAVMSWATGGTWRRALRS